MSRVGRAPIPLPAGVAVDIQGNQVTVKGPKGQLSLALVEKMTVEQKDSTLTVSRLSDDKHYRALHGLTRALLNNMVHGVSQGFQRSLDIVGVGYRAQMSGKKLLIQVGFTHPVEVEPPPGIELATEGTNRIHVRGIDKALVGQVAANLRAIRKPDPYKGKGIRYSGEHVRLKAGKTAAKKQQ